MKDHDLEQIIFEAEGLIGRLKALQARHYAPTVRGVTFDLALLDDMAGANPFTPGEKTALANVIEALSTSPLTPMIIEHLPTLGYPLAPFPPRTMSQAEFRQMYEQEAPRTEQSTGYTAVDMTTAAAQGFRDGQVSIVIELPQSRYLPGSNVPLLHVDEVKAAIIAAGGKVKE